MLAALGITIVLIPVIIVVVMTSGGEKPVLSKADIPLTQADYKEVSGQIVHTDEGHLEGILGSMRSDPGFDVYFRGDASMHGLRGAEGAGGSQCHRVRPECGMYGIFICL